MKGFYEKLATLVGYETAHGIVVNLHEIAPQINSTTKVEYASWYKVEIPEDLPPAELKGPEYALRKKDGLKARFFRAAGELTGRQDLIEKGVDYIPEPVNLVARSRTVELKGYETRYGRCYIGYDPITDTMFVRK